MVRSHPHKKRPDREDPAQSGDIENKLFAAAFALMLRCIM
jgi:hypothetical protein